MNEFSVPPRSAARRPVKPVTGWAGRAFVSVNAYGLRVVVRADSAGVLRRASKHLPPGCRPVATGAVAREYWLVASRRQGLHTVYADGGEVAQGPTLADVLSRFESDLEHYVAQHAPRRVFVHAGVVGWRGKAIVVPGRSFSGKSTLVAALIRAGATYYSDEFAVLDARGRIHPHARSLGIRENESFQATRYPVEALGGRAGSRALPVGLVVLASYRPAARWHPRRLTPGDGALALLNHAVAARLDPERVLIAIGAAAMSATFLSGSRGEADETARLILGASTWRGRGSPGG